MYQEPKLIQNDHEAVIHDIIENNPELKYK